MISAFLRLLRVSAAFAFPRIGRDPPARWLRHDPPRREGLALTVVRGPCGSNRPCGPLWATGGPFVVAPSDGDSLWPSTIDIRDAHRSICRGAAKYGQARFGAQHWPRAPTPTRSMAISIYD